MELRVTPPPERQHARIVKLKREPHLDVIRILEEILTDARKGEVQGFVLAGVDKLGYVQTAWAGDRLVFSQSGALMSLLFTLMLQSDDQVRRAAGLGPADLEG